MQWQTWSHRPGAEAARQTRLSISAALTDYFIRWSDFRGLRLWLERWRSVCLPAEPQGVEGLHALAGALCALRLDEAAPDDDAAVRVLLDQALALIETPAVLDALPLCVLHAPILLEGCQVMRRPSIAQDLERHYTRHPQWPAVPPLWRARLLDSLGAAYYVLDMQAEAHRCETQVDALAHAHGLLALRFERLKRPLRDALEAGALSTAEDLLERMAQCMDTLNLGQAVEYWDMRGRCLLAREEHAAAADAMTRAIEMATLGEMPLQRRVVLWSMASAIQLAMDQGEPALAYLRQAAGVSRGVQARVLETSLMVAQAWLASRQHQPEAVDRLRAAFTALSAMNLLRFLRPLPRVAAQLCGQALEAGIEREFALRAIAERQLPRPPDAGVTWPTPVRVTCLGPGEVTLADGRSAVRGKSPARSLELLWWIGAHDGQAVPVQGCLKALWPDAEPEAARAAFDMALGRLRRLLGSAAELRLDAGRLLPDESALWFDTAQQRELVARITRPGVTAAQGLVLAKRLIAGYGGAFAGQAGDLPWVLAARERQLARFSRGVRAAANLQRAVGDEEAVEDLLLAAMEAAPVDEALARQLMVLYRARGDAAQAARAYGMLHHAREAAQLPVPDSQTRALLGAG